VSEHSLMANGSSSAASEKKKWKSSLFGCLGYRTPTDECMFCPYFFPMSVLGTCCAAGVPPSSPPFLPLPHLFPHPCLSSSGRITTKLENEEPICLQIGSKGACTCVLSNLLFGPVGWMICGYCLRQQVIEKYRVEEEGCCLCNVVCFPCSYFQMMVSVNEWEQERQVALTGTGTTTLRNPINPAR
jgi:hypothetical protein